MPAGTPSTIVARLNAELIKALQHPDVKTFMSREGIEPVGSSPTEARAFLGREIDKIGRLIKLAGDQGGVIEKALYCIVAVAAC